MSKQTIGDKLKDVEKLIAEGEKDLALIVKTFTDDWAARTGLPVCNVRAHAQRLTHPFLLNSSTTADAEIKIKHKLRT